MNMLYQLGHTDVGEPNPQTSYADLDLDQTHTMCHSGLPPHPEVIYKKPGEDLKRDEPQRSQLTKSL